MGQKAEETCLFASDVVNAGSLQTPLELHLAPTSGEGEVRKGDKSKKKEGGEAGVRKRRKREGGQKNVERREVKQRRKTG